MSVIFIIFKLKKWVKHIKNKPNTITFNIHSKENYNAHTTERTKDEAHHPSTLPVYDLLKATKTTFKNIIKLIMNYQDKDKDHHHVLHNFHPTKINKKM